MAPQNFDRSVFINCPLDEEFSPLLEAMLFCIVYAGLKPRLASERLEGGESRLEKIIEIIAECKYSIHDLSRCKATKAGEFQRMNMPFELGVDLGFRRAPDEQTNGKKFLIFETDRYDLKRALSDIAGTDVQFHRNNFQLIMKKLRDFLKVEAGVALPGATKLEQDYYTFLGWMFKKKIHEGHSETEAKKLPTQERLEEMNVWIGEGKPAEFL